jgi:hypothetical protein
MSVEANALEAVANLGDVSPAAAAAYALGFVAGATPPEPIEFFGESAAVWCGGEVRGRHSELSHPRGMVELIDRVLR